MTKKQKETLIKLAKSLVGKPYKYGAKAKEAPGYFDCSLLAQYLLRQVGVEIPRSTIEQAEFAGKEVEDISKLEAGDLIFFKGKRGHYNQRFPEGIGHVAVYLEKGETIHAESKRVQHQPKIIEEGTVKIEPLQTITNRLKPIVIVKRIK